MDLDRLSAFAGAVQGPFLSIVNFFQSSSLFVGLHGIEWPKEFKEFIRQFADLFNFNIVPILQALKKVTFGVIDVPPLDCAIVMP